MKTKGILGCIFILASGIVFTFERYLSVLIWSVLTTPAITNGGGYLISPDMPDLKSNGFVLLFFLLGLILLILEMYDTYIQKTFSNKDLT